MLGATNGNQGQMHPYMPLHTPYAPLCAPYASLCTPYVPLCTPYVPPMGPLHAPYTPLCTPYVPPTCPYVPPMCPYMPPMHPLCTTYMPPMCPLHAPYAPPTCPLCAPSWFLTTANQITGIDQAHYNKILIFFPTTSLKCLRAARIDELADSNEPAIKSLVTIYISYRYLNLLHFDLAEEIKLCLFQLLNMETGSLLPNLHSKFIHLKSGMQFMNHFNGFKNWHNLTSSAKSKCDKLRYL